MMTHVPVLLQETIESLDLHEGQTVVDATFGRGGHAREIAKHIGRTGTLVGLDADEKNVADAETLVQSFPCRTLLRAANFKNLETELGFLEFEQGKVDRFLFDLGLNSLQLESSGRGFSFQTDEPLVMTLSEKAGSDILTAEVVLNEWSESSLEAILRGFGGEQFSGRIARAITEARKKKVIRTTFDLVSIIEEAVPNFYKHRKIHCATKTFQAIRIAVNDEFGSLRVALESAWKYAGQGGRIVVITFHEGEDRIVKKLFADFKKRGGEILTKKVIIPSRRELLDNPRSRSAKLRAIKK